MPDLAIKKVEAFAAKQRAGMGINFKNRNHEEYEWKNEQYIVINAEAENAPFADVPTELLGTDLAMDHPITVVTEDKAENLDDDDKAESVEANCEAGELPKQNENEVPLEKNGVEGNPDEHEHMEVMDPPVAQDPSPERIGRPGGSRRPHNTKDG